MSESEYQPVEQVTEGWLRSWTLGIGSSLGKNKLEILWVWRLTKDENLEIINALTEEYNWSLKSKDPKRIQRSWREMHFAWRMAELKILKHLEDLTDYQKYLHEYLMEMNFATLEEKLPWFGYDLNSMSNGGDIDLVNKSVEFREDIKKIEKDERVRFLCDPGSLEPFMDTLAAMGELPKAQEDMLRLYGLTQPQPEQDPNEEPPF